jgi:hypothetical protein
MSDEQKPLQITFAIPDGLGDNELATIYLTVLAIENTWSSEILTAIEKDRVVRYLFERYAIKPKS